MTYIAAIRYLKPKEHRAFVAERLLGLKKQLRADVHDLTNERSLRLATWNLMHFGDGGGYWRSLESMLYIAEIIDHFDLVAIQEVNENLTQFTRLMRYHLGDGWDYVLTDTAGGREGNRERLAFIYRTAKVKFLKEAGEIVLEGGQEIVRPDDADHTGDKVQFARTPFTVAFQAGWFKFRLCTVHILYGKADEDSPEMEHRRREIEKIAFYLADRQEDEARLLADTRRDQRAANYLLLGDFNIVSPQHKTMHALEMAGFMVPHGVKVAPSSLSGKHHYDQIAFKLAETRVKIGASGVFDMFDAVYRDQDAGHYLDVVKPPIITKNSEGEARDRDQQERYFKTYYRRHQMSDHKLLWCEVMTDFSDHYLGEISRDGEEGSV